MRFLPAIAAAALLPACIVHEDHGTRYGPVDHRTQVALRFEVLLNGLPCEDVPEVAAIRVTLDDPAGPVDVDVVCPQTGEQIYIPGFWPGTYPWRLSALDANGYLLYEAEGIVDVFEESPLVLADLVPADVGYGSLLFFWSFGRDHDRCAEVGVRDVEVSIGDAVFLMPCAPESFDEGAAFDVPAGMYTWSLVARGFEQDVLYVASGSVVVRAGETVDLDVALTARVVPPDPGQILLSWSFAGFTSCAVYEIENVYVQLWAGTEPLLGDDGLGIRLPCGQHEVVIDPLPAGTYTLDLHGESRRNGHAVIVFEALGVPVDVVTGMTTEINVDLKAL